MSNPLVVAYGMGVDSTAMLVGLKAQGERPDLILFADTGDEKKQTYAYLPIIQAWLEEAGFPPVTVVKNERPVSGDKSLSESLFRLGVLPSLAYGGHTCSIEWKIKPQQKFIKNWQPAKDAWTRGDTVTQCIGYDAGPRDSVRAGTVHGKAAKGYTIRTPLIEWGWDRARCVEEIQAAGLPVPVKSACWHCPASKPADIDQLAKDEPESLKLALEMERLALENGFRGEGLGRSNNWADYLKNRRDGHYSSWAEFKKRRQGDLFKPRYNTKVLHNGKEATQ